MKIRAPTLARRSGGMSGGLVMLAAVGVAAGNPAMACSPGMVTPWRHLGETGEGLKDYRRIVWAEVVALEAPARRRELQEWRDWVQQSAELQADSEARYAALKAEWVQKPDGPPLPPPEAFVDGLGDPPPSVQVTGDATLQVIEALHGDDPGSSLNIPVGGHCGALPQLGDRLLVFVRFNGSTGFFRRAGARPQQAQPSTLSIEAEAGLRRCLREQRCEGLHRIMQ